MNNICNLDWFWALSDEQIYIGILVRNDLNRYYYNKKDIKYAFKYGFMKLANLWIEADGDKIVMKLMFTDELKEISEDCNEYISYSSGII